MNCGACGHSCQGGQCTQSICQPVILVSGIGAWDLAVDTSNVYWTDAANSVWSVPIGGGNPKAIATNTYGRAIATDGNFVYWADFMNKAVMKTPVTGGSPIALATNVQNPYGVRNSNGFVYWGDFVGNALNKTPTVGGVMTMVAPSSNLSEIAIKNEEVYWLEKNGSTAALRVKKVSTMGGAVTTIYSNTYQPQSSAAADGLAVDDNYVYWTNHYADTIMKAPKNGGIASIVATATSVIDIAIDQTHLYYTDSIPGQIIRVPLSGGEAVVIANNQQGAWCIAVDGTNVYWTTTNKTLVRAAK